MLGPYEPEYHDEVEEREVPDETVVIESELDDEIIAANEERVVPEADNDELRELREPLVEQDYSDEMEEQMDDVLDEAS